jgi:quinol monooxygenase YgiN
MPQSQFSSHPWRPGYPAERWVILAVQVSLDQGEVSDFNERRPRRKGFVVKEFAWKEDGMYVVVVTIDIKDGFRERFIDAMLEDARGSVRDEPGCVRFDVIQDEKNANRIYLYEVYADRSAFDHHLTTPHFLAWKNAVQDWFASPPTVGSGPSIFPSDTEWSGKRKGNAS